jgi:hypothetical protein
MRTSRAIALLFSAAFALAPAARSGAEETRLVPGPGGAPLLARVAKPGEARPKDFGTAGTEYKHIAAAFQGIDSNVVYDGLTHFYMYPAADATWLVADLGLEDGVFLQSLTMFYLDADLNTDLTLSLCLGATHPDGGNPGFQCFWAVTTSEAPGFSAVTLDVNATVRSSFDIDGDGTKDDVRWMVFVYFPSAAAATELGGVRAAWNRQVSPAPAAATFNDVPPSDPRFPFVEALAASGITAGCGGGAFCPNAALTRGQMAVFLAKALGLNWDASHP